MRHGRRVARPPAWLFVLVAMGMLGASCGRAKTIYFVPLGKFASMPLDELERYCRDRFGISVMTLPLLPPDKSTYDPLRDQLIAQELVSQMRRAYPKEARDPDAFLIGITDGDMYIRSKDWQFAFGYREEGRFALVSAARMNPVRFGSAPNEELLRTRVRKMVTRTIAFLYKKLEATDNPSSVLHSKLLGLEELDAMGEEF